MFVPNSVEMTTDAMKKRIRELREQRGFTQEYMAYANDISLKHYLEYEEGDRELTYAFLYTCAQIFNIDVSELTEGAIPTVTTYSVTRSNEGNIKRQAYGLSVKHLSPLFRNRMIEPLVVTTAYDPENEKQEFRLANHIGQEFDYVLEGKMAIRIGEDTEILETGDSIFYDSSIPHGMLAIGGADCKFLAVMVSPEDIDFSGFAGNVKTYTDGDDDDRPDVWTEFIEIGKSESGAVNSIKLKNTERFNFAFDILDNIAEIHPDRTAMIHIDTDRTERRFTFKDMRQRSGRAANYLSSLGIKRGDRVMLVLRRNWQFWPIMMALCKIGAVAVPVIDQLTEQDYVYRFRTAGINAVIACNDPFIIGGINAAATRYGRTLTKIAVDGAPSGWCNFDSDYDRMSARFLRTMDCPCGTDPMLMVFQSYTDGMPKPACFDHTYPLASFMTGYALHGCEPGKLSFAVSDMAWPKGVWGKLYGPWLCESGVFTYNFRGLKLSDLLKYISEYRINAFSAPGSMFRALLHENLHAYDLSSLEHVSTVGDSMSAEVFTRFKEATGLTIRAGYGLADTSLITGTFQGITHKAGSVGVANPMYEVCVLDTDGQPVETNGIGEICVSVKDGIPCGIVKELYHSPAETARIIHDGYYHSGDYAWRDEDGYFWALGRVDDVIKCSGYRIGPYEIESVIMELPYVLECGVSAVPDEVRGQVVKASVVLIPEKEPTEDLKTEIQNYVRRSTAAYRYPRIVEFRTELPKTADGTVIRSKL